LTEAFPAGSSLHVVSDRGAIKVVPSDEKQVKVEISKKVHAENQQDADKYNTRTKPQITSSGKSITLNANTEGAGEHGVSTDLSIYVPANAAVVISSKHGNVTVSDRDADVEISGQRSSTTLENIKGNATLNLERSSANVTNVSGDLAINGRVNELTVTNVQGAARLNGEFMESVKLQQVGKVVTFKSSRTDMEFSRLEGSMNLDSGDLRADLIQGPARLSTRNKDIHLEGVAGDLRLADSNGTVEIVVRKAGNLQLENKNGDIQVTLPADAAFRLDARAVNGEIESDFPEVKVDSRNNQAIAAGTVRDGTALLKINNEHGTIEIRKASPQVAVPEKRTAPGRKLTHPPNPLEPTEN
jgi:hypothetical protein